MSDVVNLSVLSEIFGMPPAQSDAARKLEKTFDEQDRMLILLYFRWLTRMGARDLGITHLEKSATMTDATHEWLKTQGLENVDDWEFMGMLDHGSTASNITCSHGGHRLRYAYYAHSPSTGKELVFGLGCGSEFFQVDLGLMKKLTKVVDTAKYELSCSFYYGRAHIQMAYSPAVTMAHVMQHDAKIAELCYRYAGRTQLELWLNFINRGIMPPKTLLLHIEQAYKMAVSDRLADFAGSSRLISVYNSMMANEFVYQGEYIEKNKGIVDKGEFIYPISGESLFNALRVCCVEELMQPTPLSTYFNIIDFYQKVGSLEEQSMGIQHRAVSRAEVLYAYLSGSVKAPVKDALSCLVWACITNDARYVTLFFGLSPSSNSVLTEDWFSHCWKRNNFDYRLFAARLSKRKMFLLLFITYFTEVMQELQKWKTKSAPLEVSEDATDTDDFRTEQLADDDEDLASMFEEDDEEYEDEETEDEETEEGTLSSNSLFDMLMSGSEKPDEE